MTDTRSPQKRRKRKWGPTQGTALERGLTFLVSGAVTVQSVGPDHIRADVKVLDHAVHTVIGDRNGWRCPCKREDDRCSHIVAVKRVGPVDLR